MKNDNELGYAQKTIVGAQFLFVAFGATVLVPLLVGLDPSVALVTAGVGTLIFPAVTKGKVPIVLGSSFAFIAPIVKATELFGLPGTLSGLVAVGAVYGVMSALVRLRGVGFIARLFPPVVVGPVIMLIGLSLAGTGVNMAKSNWPLAIIALLTTVVVSMFGKGLLRLIPLFAGIVVGYIAAKLSKTGATFELKAESNEAINAWGKVKNIEIRSKNGVIVDLSGTAYDKVMDGDNATYNYLPGRCTFDNETLLPLYYKIPTNATEDENTLQD